MSVSRTRWCGPPHNAGGFEIGTKLVVRNDAASQVGDVRIGLGRHVERRGPSTIRVGLRRIEQPWARIIHHLPHDLFVRVERHCPDEFRAAEDVAERLDVAAAQVQQIAVGVIGVEVSESSQAEHSLARRDVPRERRQDVEEINEGLHVADERVAAGPGELLEDRNGIVVGIFLLEPSADLRVGRIDPVDDLGYHLALDRIED